MKRIDRNEAKCADCPYRKEKWRIEGNTAYYAGTYCNKTKCVKEIK